MSQFSHWLNEHNRFNNVPCFQKINFSIHLLVTHIINTLPSNFYVSNTVPASRDSQSNAKRDWPLLSLHHRLCFLCLSHKYLEVSVLSSCYLKVTPSAISLYPLPPQCQWLYICFCSILSFLSNGLENITACVFLRHLQSNTSHLSPGLSMQTCSSTVNSCLSK